MPISSELLYILGSTTNLKFLSRGGPKPFRNKKAGAHFARPLLTRARRMLSPAPSRPRPVAAADARGCRYVSLLDTCVRGRLVRAPQARWRPQAGEEQPRVSRLGVARHGLRRRRARPPERLQFCVEPWLDTSTLDPDTVRHHPTLRHQCQSTLDRHSARHSDTSVQPS